MIDIYIYSDIYKIWGLTVYIRLPIKGLISGRGYISPTQQSLIAVVFCLWVGPSTTDTSIAQFLHLWPREHLEEGTERL